MTSVAILKRGGHLSKIHCSKLNLNKSGPARSAGKTQLSKYKLESVFLHLS